MSLRALVEAAGRADLVGCLEEHCAELRYDMTDSPREANVMYTTRRQTTGTTKPDTGWRAAVRPFRVTARLWKASSKTVFMHDLLARGGEVSAGVLDGHTTIAFEQARNKSYGAIAVLEWCRSAR